MLRSKQLFLSWKGVSLLLFISVLLTACSSNNDASAEPLVIYKASADSEQEHVITEEDFDKFIAVTRFMDPSMIYYEEIPGFKQGMLDQYISMRIFGDRLDDASKEEEDKQIDENFNEDSIPEEMQDQMDEEGLSFDDFRSYFQLSSYAAAYLEGQVNESDVQREYEASIEADPDAYTLATVSHILIKTVDPVTEEEIRSKEEALEIAEMVRDKLLNGEDFAELAAEYSEDEGSAANGGTYEDANVNGWVEGFREAALELPLDTISEPVETIYGYHIMRVSDRRIATIEDVEDQLRSQLTNEIYTSFLENELPDLVVENNLPEDETDEGSEASEDQGAVDEEGNVDQDSGVTEGEASDLESDNSANEVDDTDSNNG